MPGKPKPAARWYSGIRVCRSIGSEIAHWLFWQKKTTGALKTDGVDERLVHVTLATGAVTEVGDRRLTVLVADRVVALLPHRVPGRVQRLGADHDRVEVEVIVSRVPGSLVDAAEQAEQIERVDALAPGDAVLAVGREDHVVLVQGAAGADLRGLLAEQGSPQAELPLTLQGGRLGVDPANHDHVPVEALDRLVVEVEREVRMLDAFTFRRQQLDELDLFGGLGGTDRRLHGREHFRGRARHRLTHMHSSGSSAGSPRPQHCTGPRPSQPGEASQAGPRGSRVDAHRSAVNLLTGITAHLAGHRTQQVADPLTVWTPTCTPVPKGVSH